MKIGIDIMGGDFAPVETTLGAIKACNELPLDIGMVLIGDTQAIEQVFVDNGINPSANVELVHSEEIIEMGEHPTKAFAKKPKSSISLGFKLLKEGKIQGFASTGNTGAMLVGSMYTVRAVPGIIRPCITSVLPCESGGYNFILDVGANADCKPDVLYQFAILGSLYAKHVHNIDSPKVGLLNIGEEEGKGNLLTQATYELMKDSRDFNFVGNVEGRDIFGDKMNIIVCDGFTGNVVLKEAEAFYSILKKRDMLDEYFSKFNYETYGGTPILGVNSNVVIGHGISNSEAIKNMLLLTKDVIEANLTQKINEAFQ